MSNTQLTNKTEKDDEEEFALMPRVETLGDACFVYSEITGKDVSKIAFNSPEFKEIIRFVADVFSETSTVTFEELHEIAIAQRAFLRRNEALSNDK